MKFNPEGSRWSLNGERILRAAVLAVNRQELRSETRPDAFEPIGISRYDRKKP
jgi:hypothetical protein